MLGHLNVLRPGEAVVYLSGEGHAGMKRRIMAWGAARGLTRAQIEALPFYYKTSVPPTKDGNAGGLRYIAGIKQFCTPVLIVIDTMTRSLGAEDENTAAAANAYLDGRGDPRSVRLHDADPAHSGKGEGAAARGVRGSSAFTGGFDAIWFLEANKENRTAKLEAAWLKDADEMGRIASAWSRFTSKAWAWARCCATCRSRVTKTRSSGVRKRWRSDSGSARL